jgi:hypothetical protein
MADIAAYPLDVVETVAVPDTLAAHLRVRGFQGSTECAAIECIVHDSLMLQKCFVSLGEKDSYNIALAGGSLLTLLASSIRITDSSDAGTAPIPWNRCNIWYGPIHLSRLLWTVELCHLNT